MIYYIYSPTDIFISLNINWGTKTKQTKTKNKQNQKKKKGNILQKYKSNKKRENK